MHTLVITNDFPPHVGGIERFVEELVGRFPPERVTVLASSRGRLTREELARADAARPYRVIRHPDRILLPTPRVTRFAIKLARHIGADSIWFGAAAPLALMARDLRRSLDLKRIVATTHGHEVWWALTPPSRVALARIGDSVDHLTYIADYTRGRIAPALSPAGRARLVRLTPGVTPAAFAQPPAGHGAAGAAQQPAAAPVVLSVSRLVPRKGQDQLIRGWPRVVAAHPDARLVIAGSGPYEPVLRRMAAASPAAASIELKGQVVGQPLIDLYARADVFAMPCRTRLAGLEVEGLGIVYLEAGAAGVPVVAGDSGGAPEAVLPGRTGFVVDGRSPEPAAARIIELLDDPARARAMGGAGREWVRRDWDWQTRHETLAALLNPDA
ncbi:MAG: glycosyltransferase family 4 protein [Bifidobacteriaceae bacterium]|nr:glycosyltransferase family 4 protein [Bifidobacteriaceae bacterium]